MAKKKRGTRPRGRAEFVGKKLELKLARWAKNVVAGRATFADLPFNGKCAALPFGGDKCRAKLPFGGDECKFQLPFNGKCLKLPFGGKCTSAQKAGYRKAGKAGYRKAGKKR